MTMIEKWKLPVPTDLEGWARHPITISRREYFPWLNDAEYARMITRVSIVSYRFLYGRLMASAETSALTRSLKFRLARALIVFLHTVAVKPLIKLRIDLGVYSFPVEWAIYRALRDRVVKMI